MRRRRFALQRGQRVATAEDAVIRQRTTGDGHGQRSGLPSAK
jgi:hypothetical protein